jgi:hypothetical protein
LLDVWFNKQEKPTMGDNNVNNNNTNQPFPLINKMAAKYIKDLRIKLPSSSGVPVASGSEGTNGFTPGPVMQDPASSPPKKYMPGPQRSGSKDMPAAPEEGAGMSADMPAAPEGAGMSADMPAAPEDAGMSADMPAVVNEDGSTTTYMGSVTNAKGALPGTDAQLDMASAEVSSTTNDENGNPVGKDSVTFGQGEITENGEHTGDYAGSNIEASQTNPDGSDDKEVLSAEVVTTTAGGIDGGAKGSKTHTEANGDYQKDSASYEYNQKPDGDNTEKGSTSTESEVTTEDGGKSTSKEDFSTSAHQGTDGTKDFKGHLGTSDVTVDDKGTVVRDQTHTLDHTDTRYADGSSHTTMDTHHVNATDANGDGNKDTGSTDKKTGRQSAYNAQTGVTETGTAGVDTEVQSGYESTKDRTDVDPNYAATRTGPNGEKETYTYQDYDKGDKKLNDTEYKPFYNENGEQIGWRKAEETAGSESGSGASADTSVEDSGNSGAGSKAGSEAPAKTGSEAPTKAGSEAPAKTGSEAPTKAGSEAPTKAGSEAPTNTLNDPIEVKVGSEAGTGSAGSESAATGSEPSFQERSDATARRHWENTEGSEAPAKKGSEAPAKTGSEAPAKTGSEAPAKTGSEAPAKTGSEAPAKTGSETPAKTGSETPAKTGSETPAKTGSETPAKTGSESSISREGSAGSEGATGSEAGTGKSLTARTGSESSNAGSGESTPYVSPEDRRAAGDAAYAKANPEKREASDAAHAKTTKAGNEAHAKANPDTQAASQAAKEAADAKKKAGDEAHAAAHPETRDDSQAAREKGDEVHAAAQQKKTAADAADGAGATPNRTNFDK